MGCITSSENRIIMCEKQNQSFDKLFSENETTNYFQKRPKQLIDCDERNYCNNCNYRNKTQT